MSEGRKKNAKSKSSLPGGVSVVQIYADMVKTLEQEMGDHELAAILGNVRESGVVEMLPISDDEATMRMMTRLGWLEKLSSTERVKRAEDIMREFSETIDRTPAVTSIVFRIYADGLYGVLPKGICSNVPVCKKCRLTKICSYYNAPRPASAREKHISPEARIERDGARVLSDEELLGIIIGGGKSSDKTLKQASGLINRFGSLQRLAGVSCTELSSLADISKTIAVRIVSALGISMRVLDEKRSKKPNVRCGKDFYDLYWQRLRETQQEVFWVILLDQKNCIMTEQQIAQGSLNRVFVHPREVFAPAIRNSASAIAIIHNHPSGDPTPSKEDEAITARIKSTGEIMGIKLLDHVIIGDGCYTSFVDDGLLK